MSDALVEHGYDKDGDNRDELEAVARNEAKSDEARWQKCCVTPQSDW